VDTPIVVDNWLSGSAPTMVNRRLLILMEQDSQATIIINDRADQPIQAMATQVTEVICHDGAHLDLYEVEETTPTCSRFAGTYISEGRDCTVHHTSVTLSGGHTRNTVDVTLNGEHSDVTLNGCAIANGTQRVDCNTLIHHRVPHCRSNQLYKYVVDNHAVGAFAGKILVDSGATATTSTETNANLLASSQARMFAQPMLEIYADDVQCSHGSTTGVMDESALLYMRQRGIPESQARTLLKNAFMGQVIDQVQHEPLRQKLYVKVEKRFQGENQKCEECRLCQTN
jgi:Fe-S cluster assembly protein SufD